MEYQEAVNYCDTHPNVETGLACGRCERFICPRCMIQTPVGSRCGDCAQVRKSPVFDVTAKQYVIASAAAVGLGGVLGVAWAVLLNEIGGIFFLPGLLAAAVGYLVGEAVSVAANRKRGLGLSLVAASGVVIAYSVSMATTLTRPGGFRFDLVDMVFALLFLALAVYISVSRVR